MPAPFAAFKPPEIGDIRCRMPIAAIETPPAKDRCRVTQSEQFGVSCRVRGQLAFVMTLSNDFWVAERVAHNHGANGDIAVFK